jgi:hypothetical protein
MLILHHNFQILWYLLLSLLHLCLVNHNKFYGAENRWSLDIELKIKCKIMVVYIV